MRGLRNAKRIATQPAGTEPRIWRGHGGSDSGHLRFFFFLVLIALFDWVTRAPGKDPFAKTLIHRTDRSFALAALA